MTSVQVKRKLAAILSADVQGYSRLIGADEEGTIRTLKAYLEIFNGFIQHHRGHLMATGGDHPDRICQRRGCLPLCSG